MLWALPFSFSARDGNGIKQIVGSVFVLLLVLLQWHKVNIKAMKRKPVFFFLLKNKKKKRERKEKKDLICKVKLHQEHHNRFWDWWLFCSLMFFFLPPFLFSYLQHLASKWHFLFLSFRLILLFILISAFLFTLELFFLYRKKGWRPKHECSTSKNQNDKFKAKITQIQNWRRQPPHKSKMQKYRIDI